MDAIVAPNMVPRCVMLGNVLEVVTGYLRRTLLVLVQGFLQVFQVEQPTLFTQGFRVRRRGAL